MVDKMFPLGLIGFPLSHSLSPWIHKSFFEKVNVLGTYKLYEIEQEDFSTKVSEIKRSEEHTSELQSRGHLVCRLLLEKKKINKTRNRRIKIRNNAKRKIIKVLHDEQRKKLH